MTYVYTTETTSSIAHALTNDSYASWHADYEACMALAEYLECLAEDMGEPIELDTVALRCDFSLYEDIAEYNQDYGTEHEDIDDLEDSGVCTVIRVDDDRFIVSSH